MKFIARILHFWRAARCREELRALSDRTLRDIGVRREQIDALFR